ncbi:MAG: serine/threonine protein kinase [Chloroflexi bacterium CFX2]|nr:serine/threonine protein kinase [Chloroflexi bacterium CFX2]
MSFKPGETVGPYQIIAQLGQGGMASVFKAYHPALDRYVALKVLHQAFNEDSTFIGRFQREARVVAKLEHPNIVPVYDYAEHEGRPYLVMKFIEGDTLKARMAAGPLSSKEIERVVETVGSALGYAHRQGVLHRDIKPSNVLISMDNVMYLADFGLARIAAAGETTLSTDSVMGTPQYISPEQAMGRKDLDARTDIYSFGVMLYEVVVGQVPFSADTPFSIIHDHIYTPLPLPMSVNPNVPEPVQRVLLKALAKNWDDRYQNVEELIGAFKSAWLEAGIPMRGSDVTIAPGSVKPAPAPLATPRVAANSKAENPLKRQETKRNGWMWAAVGLVTIMCFGVGLLALRNTLPVLSQRGRGTIGTPTLIAGLPPQSQGEGNPPPVGFATPTMIPKDKITPEIQKAYELVRDNPGSPAAHLELSLAFWDAGLELPAMEEFGKVSALAGPDDKEFYVDAADAYRNRQAWHLAAGMYLRAIPIFVREDGFVPIEVRDGFRESAYRGAEYNDLPVVLPFEQVSGFQSDFANIVRGRHALFLGELAKAESALSAAENSSETLAEANLLKAEILIEKGNPADAKQVLAALGADANAPKWVLIMADEILRSMP